ncbi:MAG TPA: septal ring lytic transglycosylase RlpA family protein [Stellaceae bacterium]|nr:septal ring lytic transglycosylase RlpA family protein [Stellaceae bacterium]
MSLIALLAMVAGCAAPPPKATTTGPTSESGRGQYKIGQPYQIGGTWYYPAEDFNYDESGIASWYGEDFHGKFTANGEVFDLNGLTAAHRTLPMPSVVEITNLDNGRRLAVRVNDRGPFARGRIIDVSRRAAQLLGFEGNGTAKVRVKILVPETIQVASIARRNGTDDKVPADAIQAAPRAPVVAEALPPPPGVRVASAQAQQILPARTPAAAPPARAVIEPPPPLPEKVAVVPVKATQIYIQAGAFARADNAIKVKSRLDGLGSVKVTGTRVNGVDLYRVRLGPVGNVDEADKLLDRVIATGIAEARIVVD